MGTCLHSSFGNADFSPIQQARRSSSAYVGLNLITEVFFLNQGIKITSCSNKWPSHSFCLNYGQRWWHSGFMLCISLHNNPYSLDNSCIVANEHLLKNASEVQTTVTRIKFAPPAAWFFHDGTQPDLSVWTMTPTLSLVTVAQL